MTCMPTRPWTVMSSTACWFPRPSWTEPPEQRREVHGRSAEPAVPGRRPALLPARPDIRVPHSDDGRLRRLQLHPTKKSRQYTPDQVIDFYAECGFDLGISVDHVIFGFDPAADTDPHHPQAEQWRSRQQITLDLAAEFLARCKATEGPVRASRRRAGMEPRLLRGSGPQPPEDRLHAHRPRRHGPAQDTRNPRLPPGNLRSPRPATRNFTCWASRDAATSRSSPPTE